MEHDGIVPGLNDDCPYYFRPEGCLFGYDCPRRHSEVAKGSFEICPQWAEGDCEDWVGCPLRHMTQEGIDEEMNRFYPELVAPEPANADGVNNASEGVKRAVEDDSSGDNEDGPVRKRPRLEEPSSPGSLDDPKEPEEPKGPECRICFEEWTTIKNNGLNWVALYCGHLLCSACSDEVWGQGQGIRACPVCQVEFTMAPIRIYW